MASSTQSPKETNNPGQEDYEDLVRRESHASNYHQRQQTPAELLERIPTMSNEDGQELDEERGLADTAPADETTEEHEDQFPGGYKKNQKRTARGRIRQWRRRRTLLAGAGLFATLLTTGLIILFGFLHIFKLDNIMSNIDARTFTRLNGVADRRSLAWMEAYMRMRLADIGDHPNLDKGADSDNQFFRSEKVRNNPVTDWYKTLRTSKFEENVFNKEGFKFVSVRTANGRIRPGKITLNDKTLVNLNVSEADWDGLARGDVASIRKYNTLVNLNKFANDKEARKAIKETVNANTRFFQVIKRRHIRKDIQNMTGVRDWRFFENTRNATNEKIIDVRNKIIDKAVPEGTKSGKFIKCLFGISDCRFSEDPSDPANQSDSSIRGDDRTKDDSYNTQDPDSGEIKPKAVDYGPAADLIKDVVNKLSAAFSGLNAVAFLDSIENVNTAIHNHKLSKGVEIARGTQAMGLYQVFETARDQIKTGQLTSGEFDKLMQVISSVAASEGWTKVINGDGDASKLTNTPKSRFYCSQESQSKLAKDPSLAEKDDRFSFAYLCGDKQIGSISTAANLENGYNDTVGAVINPLMKIYSPLRHNPIGDVLGFLNNVISSITSKLTQAVIDTLGLGNTVKDLGNWLATHVASFLGAGPIMTGNEPAGVYMNWLVQGGAFTAESSARMMGAAKTTPVTKVTAQATTAQYLADQQSDMSLFDKYLSLSNPDSPAARSAFALSQLNMSSITSHLTDFSLIFKAISSIFTLPFNSHALAQSADNGYRGADFAGIQTFDFPQQCVDLDPITATPTSGTNALAIFNKYHLKPSDDDLANLNSWGTEDDAQAFYSTIYGVIGDRDNADTIAEQIYNCNLLDTPVRGGLGYVYGYTDDNGIEDSSTGSSPNEAGSGSVSGDTQDLAKQILSNPNISYPLDAISPNGSTKAVLQALSRGEKAPVYCSNAGVTSTDVNPGILKMILELGSQGKVGVNAITDKCHTAGSNHYKGQAVDFECQGVPFDTATGDRIASKYGGKRNSETCGGDSHWHYDFSQ